MMSIWYTIEDPEDVDIDRDCNEINILYNSDNQGNYYVAVPIKILQDKIDEFYGDSESPSMDEK